MKNTLKRIVLFMMAALLFLSCPLSVYASDEHPWEGGLGLQLYYNLDEILKYIKDTGQFWLYAASEMGALVRADFVKFAENYKKMDEILETEKDIGVYVNENGEMKGLFFSKEFMSQLKVILDEYAKEEQSKEENGGYIIVPTMDMTTIPPQWFLDSGNYKTFRNLMAENGLLMVTPKNGWGTIGAYFLFGDPFYDHSEKKKTDIVLVADKDSLERYRADPSLPLTANFYDANRCRSDTVYRYTFRDSDVHQSWNEGPGIASTNTYSYYMRSCLLNATTDNVKERNTFLCSLTGERVRVFVSEIAAQNYSVGNRKVYFTENYYNYVPEDLSVSVDDLQKSVDDLKNILDQLLGQIGDNTSEKEIEELLKKILEAIQSQPGGDGPGNGDINVDIDLSSTNTLLSKILAKITQIFDKMDAAVEDAGSAAMSKIQESLDEIIVQLKKIKHWTVAGTVIDAADAVADWADLILGILKDAEEGAGSAVAAIATTVGDSVDMMSRKFPFSVPWDILFFVSVLSAEPVMPYFEIPFNFEISALDITIDYTMKLDFSQLQWLSDLSRLLLSMTYAVGLMKMTFGVTSVGKEE